MCIGKYIKILLTGLTGNSVYFVPSVVKCCL